MTDQPGQQPGQQPPLAYLDITVQGSVMTSSFVPPTVRVNGALVGTRYGTTRVPVYAGPTRVEAHSQWLWRYGRAALEVMVPPGAVVPVFYASPLTTWSKGNIGHTPQKRPGLIGLVAILGGIALATVLLIAVLASL